VSKVDCVVIVGKLNFEGQGVVIRELWLNVAFLKLLLLLLHLLNWQAEQVARRFCFP
jgi:hypothetical protein